MFIKPGYLHKMTCHVLSPSKFFVYLIIVLHVVIVENFIQEGTKIIQMPKRTCYSILEKNLGLPNHPSYWQNHTVQIHNKGLDVCLFFTLPFRFFILQFYLIPTANSIEYAIINRVSQSSFSSLKPTVILSRQSQERLGIHSVVEHLPNLRRNQIN
jgi:hypothetical protein